MSGGGRVFVLDLERSSKVQQQQGCFSVAGILLCIWKSKAPNGLNWELVHIRILWHWDVSPAAMPGLSFISFSLHPWMNFAQFVAAGRGCWCCALCRWDALCPAVFPGILLPNLCVFTGWAALLLCSCLRHLGRAGRINIPVFPSHTKFPEVAQACGCISSPAGSSHELSEAAGHCATGTFGLYPSSNWWIVCCCSMQMGGF